MILVSILLIVSYKDTKKTRDMQALWR